MDAHATHPGGLQLRTQQTWETIAAFAREGAGRLMQHLLEEEVDEKLEQARAGAEAGRVCRSGHGRPRRLRTPAGDLQVRRPRVRGTALPLQSEVLPQFSRRARQAGSSQIERYLEALANEDFDLALNALLGRPAPVSDGCRARVRRRWQIEQQAWRSCSLSGMDVQYLWVDRLLPSDGSGDPLAPPVLVALAGLVSGEARVLAVEPSSRSCARLLDGLKRRGLKPTQLVVGGGQVGLPGSGKRALARRHGREEG